MRDTALWSVTVVGCGGTGGHVAEGLCRQLPPRCKIVLVDPDRVEQRNLVRQNFLQGELGQFKSEALALRLARQYQRTVGYSVYPIGYVDSLLALDAMGLVI
ncbi:MAG: ThiF family adenylyltransferase, partial [Dehalococcoidia bacterium]|nr:ThiF family adenylyltransferase [Dehalococcoidia bacterium]